MRQKTRTLGALITALVFVLAFMIWGLCRIHYGAYPMSVKLTVEILFFPCVLLVMHEFKRHIREVRDRG